MKKSQRIILGLIICTSFQFSQGFKVLNPKSGSRWCLGGTLKILWIAPPMSDQQKRQSTFDIRLIKSGKEMQRLGRHPYLSVVKMKKGTIKAKIKPNLPPGNDYNILIRIHRPDLGHGGMTAKSSRFTVWKCPKITTPKNPNQNQHETTSYFQL